MLTLARTGEDADPSAGSGTGIGVSQMQVQGSMVYLQVNGATTSSFVRIDMVGDHSDVPIAGADGLLFESLDVDGTALLTRGAGTDAAPQRRHPGRRPPRRRAGAARHASDAPRPT